MKYYYLIDVTVNEYHSAHRYIADTFEEARERVKDYANWWCPDGSCSIVKVDKNFHTVKTWNYYDNKFRPGDPKYRYATEDHDD